MTNKDTDALIEKVEWIKWQLAELANTDPNDIESNEIEIVGENALGQEGYCTAKITDIAEQALSLITDSITPAVTEKKRTITKQEGASILSEDRDNYCRKKNKRADNNGMFDPNTTPAVDGDLVEKVADKYKWFHRMGQKYPNENYVEDFYNSESKELINLIESAITARQSLNNTD